MLNDSIFQVASPQERSSFVSSLPDREGEEDFAWRKASGGKMLAAEGSEFLYYKAKHQE